MDLKIVIFCTILQYKVCLCLYPLINTNQFYTVTTDQKHTDRETSIYTKNTALTKTIIAEKLEFLIHRHVCKRKPEVREFICKELLEVDKNGFTLDWSEPLQCKNESYTILFPTLTESTNFKLSIFSCPQVFYKDLETGEEKRLPYTYKVSIGRTYDSAILFIQKDSHANDLYPQKYVENISFKNIKLYLKFIQLSIKTFSEDKLKNYVKNAFPKSVKMKPILDVVSFSSTSFESERTKLKPDEIIKEYIQQRHETLPYHKFQKFFSSINICGLRRAQKMYLCKQAIITILQINFDFDFLSYKISNCRRYDVRLLKVNERKENNPQLQNELYLIRCPPIKTESFTYIRTSQTIHLHYVASNLLHHSITLFTRNNDKKETPQQIRNFEQLKMDPIIEYVNRERYLPEPLKVGSKKTLRQKSYQEIEDEINSFNKEVRMPLTLRKMMESILGLTLSEANHVLQSTPDRWLTEKVLISFSKIKATKLIYKRFMKTYKSIDICHLTIVQKTLICNIALKELKELGDKYPFSTDSNLSCLRRKVILTVIEADEYDINIFSMWGCQSDVKYKNLYFLGKNHLNDSAIIYKRDKFAGVEYYYPLTLITKIDRYKLSRANVPLDVKYRFQYP